MSVGDGDIGQDIFKNSIDLIAYIADGIADGFPIVGKLVKAILGLISDSAKSAMGGVNMLDKFAQQLKASDAQLETDLASADIMTYQFWAAGHYQDQWVADVVKGTNDNRSALADFASKVAADLDDRNSRILTAANLMMTQKPTPNDNLNYPTLAMLKSNGFFYLANYVLTLGRQAFNAQLALEGNATAAKTGALLVRLSTVYTAYATALKAAVDQQYAARVGYMQLSIDHAHTQIDIIDNWDPDPSNRPAASRIWTVELLRQRRLQRQVGAGPSRVREPARGLPPQLLGRGPRNPRPGGRGHADQRHPAPGADQTPVSRVGHEPPPSPPALPAAETAL